MDKILALMNPFMKKELTSILYLHSDMNEFYKFVPQQMLPKEYGGPLEDTNVLKGKLRKEILSLDLFKRISLLSYRALL